MNQKDASCLGTAVLAMILFGGLALLCAIVWPSSMSNSVRVDYRPIVRVEPTPVPTATPNAIFEALLAKARAAATAEVIRAEANAKSQATNDEIRLAWNKHLMRRWWAVLSIPAVAIFGGIAAYLYFWREYRIR